MDGLAKLFVLLAAAAVALMLMQYPVVRGLLLVGGVALALLGFARGSRFAVTTGLVAIGLFAIGTLMHTGRRRTVKCPRCGGSGRTGALAAECIACKGVGRVAVL